MHYCTVLSHNAPRCSAKLLSKPVGTKAKTSLPPREKMPFGSDKTATTTARTLIYLAAAQLVVALSYFFCFCGILRGSLKQQQLPALSQLKRRLMGFFLLIELIENALDRSFQDGFQTLSIYQLPFFHF